MASYRPPLDHPSWARSVTLTFYELRTSAIFLPASPDDGPVLLETSTCLAVGDIERHHSPNQLQITYRHRYASTRARTLIQDPVPIPSHLPPNPRHFFAIPSTTPTPSQTNTDTDIDTASRPRILHIPFRRIGIVHAVVRPGAATG